MGLFVARPACSSDLLIRSNRFHEHLRFLWELRVLVRFNASVDGAAADWRNCDAGRGVIDRSTLGSMDFGVVGPERATSRSAVEPSKEVGPVEAAAGPAPHLIDPQSASLLDDESEVMGKMLEIGVEQGGLIHRTLSSFGYDG
jgi:hypothetical protein